jgi:transmembrane sensor
MTDLEDTLAWRQGQIVFDRTPLRDALARFAWFHGRVITVTPGAADQRLSGRYSLDNLDDFLAALQAVELPVRVATTASGAIRVSLKNEP